MSWNSDTCCLTSMGGSPTFYWYVTSGWLEAWHNSTNLRCAGQHDTTYADYYHVSTYGNNNDCNMTTSFYAPISGGCTWLLRHAFTIHQSRYCF